MRGHCPSSWWCYFPRVLPAEIRLHASEHHACLPFPSSTCRTQTPRRILSVQGRTLLLQVSGTNGDPLEQVLRGHLQTNSQGRLQEEEKNNTGRIVRHTKTNTEREGVLFPEDPNFRHIFHDTTPHHPNACPSGPQNQTFPPKHYF